MIIIHGNNQWSLSMLSRTGLLSIVFTLAALPAFAAPQEYVLTIKDHKFSPAELTIPADTKVKLKIVNQDASPEEFESHDLDREKVVGGNSDITVSIGPLKTGEYSYFGDFHEDTAKGKIIVK
jgi:plastocyanin